MTAGPRPPSEVRLFRPISGLKYAAETTNPWPKVRLRGARAAGLTYERRFAAAVPQARHGLWFSFIDANGAGNCSPDFVLDLADHLVVFELKLSDKPYARDQIRQLYMPVLTMVYAKPIRGVVVTKILRPWSDLEHVTDSLRDAIDRANGTIPTLHWLGKGKIP